MNIKLGIVLWAQFACFLSCAQEPKNIITGYKIKKNKLFIRPEASFTRQYLRQSTFYVEYGSWVNLNRMPYSVVTIPFVMCMAPIIWASNQSWTIDVMDQDLYESLKKIRQVFKLFYPSLDWSGQLLPKKIVKNRPQKKLKNNYRALLFSGGLDAICSSFMHQDKKQLLITLHGYDVPFGKTTMWRNVQDQCERYAYQYGHDLAFIRFNFRSLVNIYKLAKLSREIPVWIEYTSEALSHTGVTAPLLYQLGYTNLLMASSVTIDYPFAYGTHPAIDNFISFANINVHHDGDTLTRLEKLAVVKKISEKNRFVKPELRVCWGFDKNGGNCGRCEKCLRTMHEVLVLGEGLKTWGFNSSLRQLKKATQLFLQKKPYIGGNWLEAQEEVQRMQLRSKKFYSKDVQEYLKWFIALDLQKLHTISDRHQKRCSFFQEIWKAAQKNDIRAILRTKE